MNRLIHEIQKRQGIQTIFWILILAVLWEAFSRLGWINAYLLPSFSTVLRATYAEIAAGRYLFQVLNSFYMILLGFAISAALALVIITLCIWSKVIHSFVKSLCILLAPLPGVAIMPIIILLFGIDTKAMVVLMVHSVLWPLTMNALSGIQTIDEYLIVFDLNASEIYQRIAKDGGKPKTARTPVFPAGWKDQFGLPYREHQKSLQINIFDGYAIYGIKDSSVSSTASVENVTSVHTAYQPEVPVQEGSVNG